MRREEVMRQRFMERLQNNEKMYVLGVIRSPELGLVETKISLSKGGCGPNRCTFVLIERSV